MCCNLTFSAVDVHTAAEQPTVVSSRALIA